jgi:hypothetical protein
MGPAAIQQLNHVFLMWCSRLVPNFLVADTVFPCLFLLGIFTFYNVRFGVPGSSFYSFNPTSETVGNLLRSSDN